MGVPVSGRFKPFNTKLAFDPAQPAAALIASSVGIGSAALGDREPDTELLKPVRFVVALFLQANVRSTTVKRLDVIRFDVASKLSIKGVSSHVVVPVTLAQTGAQTGATGSFPPSASLFGSAIGSAPTPGWWSMRRRCAFGSCVPARSSAEFRCFLW